MIVLKKKKEIQHFKKAVINYIEHFWKKGYNPSIKELKNDLNIKNIQLLKKTLRIFRITKILDGSYDGEGVYRIYRFKSLTSESILYSNMYE